MLRHEGSFIANRGCMGQDSLPDPRADKSHGRYLVSWRSGGQKGKLRERFLHIRSMPLAGLHRGWASWPAAGFTLTLSMGWGESQTAEIRGQSCSSLLPADCRHPTPGPYPAGTERQTENLQPKA